MKRTPLTSSIELQRDWEERTREKARARRLKRAQREGLSPRRVRALPKRGRKYVEKRKKQFGDDGKREWIISLPCLVYGTVPSEPHHEPPVSRGGKAGDMVPLSRIAHAFRHDVAGSAEAFELATGVDLLAAARRLEEEWLAA